jgi:shikimate kinase
MNLLVCGFMGAGKTTLGQSLKGLNVLDLDLELEKRFQLSIHHQVLEIGWDQFREREFHLLIELLTSYVHENWIIILGGGALSFEKLKILRQCIWVKILWLDVPFEICWERIHEDSSRPLVAHGKEWVQNLYQERNAIYQMSDFTVSNSLQAEKLIGKLVK